MELKDLGGLQQIKGIKLQGATKWIGTSANVAAMDTTAGAPITFSLTNYSANAAVIDSTSSTAATNAAVITQVIAALAAAGICTETHNGS